MCTLQAVCSVFLASAFLLTPILQFSSVVFHAEQR
jgi:hypothetical protein